MSLESDESQEENRAMTVSEGEEAVTVMMRSEEGPELYSAMCRMSVQLFFSSAVTVRLA